MLAMSLVATQIAGQKPTLKPIPAKDKVIATVDGIPIHAGDIEQQLWDWHAYEVLQDTIINRIVDQKAVGAKVSVNDKEIQAAYDNQIEQIKANLGPTGDVDQALRDRGGSRSRLWLGARREVQLAKLLGLAWDAKDFVNVSTLLIRSQSESATDVGAAIAKANEAYGRLQKGETWTSVFSHYNAEANVTNNGALGYVQISKFPTVTQKELATLKAGGVTKPVQTGYGFQIFKIEKFARDAAPNEVANLKDQFINAQKRTYLEGLIQSAKVQRSL